jgi:AhpC/TSA family
MSNALTGDYDAVFEITQEAVVRMLANIHQKGDAGSSSPTFIHSVTVRVGNLSKLTSFALAENFLLQNFSAAIPDVSAVPAESLQALQRDLMELQSGARQLATDIGSAIKPGAALDIGSLVGSLIDVAVVRGTAKVQVGTLGLSVDDGATHEVVVSAPIRAHYYADSNTAALPTPIHGKVWITFTVGYAAFGSNGKPAIEVKVTTDKNKIGFDPEAGTLTTAQAAQITRQIQTFVRTRLGAMSIDVPPGFVFNHFKGLTAGNVSVIALPIMLGGDAALPEAKLAGVHNIFVPSDDDFTVVVSNDYIDSKLLNQALAQLGKFNQTYVVTDDFFGIVWARIHVWVANVSVNWYAGGFDIVVNAHVHVWNRILSDEDYDVTVTQSLTLTLANNTLIVPDPGDPTIQGLPQDFVGYAWQDIVKARDDALKTMQPILLSAIPFGVAFGILDAGAFITAAEVRSEGVMVHGKVNIGPRPKMVVDFSETSDGKSLTAFKSWVPGGEIKQFTWSWQVSSGPMPWDKKTVALPVRKHDFVLNWTTKPGLQPWEVPPPPWKSYGICLTVDGIQEGRTAWTGQAVSGKNSTVGSCGGGMPQWADIEPAWWANVLMIPIWGPDPAERFLESAIMAQVNVRPAVTSATAAQATARRAARSSVLIHFAGGEQAPLPALTETMHKSKHRQSGIPIFVVLPSGSFSQRKSVVEAGLGAFGEDLALPLVITEDYEGGWSQAFNAAGGQATYLLSPDGQLAWKHQGALDATAAAAALDQNAVPAPVQRSRLIRNALRVGQSAPDVIFTAGGHRGLRGKPLLVVFYKSWSTPCVNELVRLQQFYREGRGRGPTILAITDGQDQKQTDALVRQHGLDFLVVPDPNRSIARPCGINCWPTLIGIDENGTIGGMNHGATHPPHLPSAVGTAAPN